MPTFGPPAGLQHVCWTACPARTRVSVPAAAARHRISKKKKMLATAPSAAPPHARVRCCRLLPQATPHDRRAARCLAASAAERAPAQEQRGEKGGK